MPKPIERLQMRMRGELPKWPLPSLLGIRLTSVQPGHIMVEYEFNEQHQSTDGLSIGVLCTMFDLAMYGAFGSTLEEGEVGTLLEMKINFLKHARKGTLRATGKLVNGGRTIGLVECDILDDSQQLVAHAVGTCMKLENK